MQQGELCVERDNRGMHMVRVERGRGKESREIEMLTLKLCSQCGCFFTTEYDQFSATGDELRISNEVFGWYECAHNKDEEKGVVVYKLLGTEKGTGFIVYTESSKHTIQ